MKLIFAFFVPEVNKPRPHSVSVLEVKGYGFLDFTISKVFSSLFISQVMGPRCGTWSRPDPILTSFAFLFSIRSLTFNPRAEFEVYTFTHSRDIRGFQNRKSRSCELGNAPFGPVFNIFRYYYYYYYYKICIAHKFKRTRVRGAGTRLLCFTLNLHTKFEICNFKHSRDIRGSQNVKCRSRNRGHAIFWPIFHFLV